MDLRLRLPGVIRVLQHTRCGSTLRGYAAPKAEFHTRTEKVAKWGNWHCGQNKERFCCKMMLENMNGIMKIGDRVRVKESVVVYHNPEHRNQGFDLKGSEGEVVAIATKWHDRPVSANLPILVQFTKKFKSHLRESELEVI
jgi:hypothetical protein